MLTSELKEEIKRQIDTVNDDELLNEINILINNSTKLDWWESLPNAAQNGILQGYNEWKEGKVLSHTEVMEIYKK